VIDFHWTSIGVRPARDTGRLMEAKRPISPGDYLPIARELMQHRDEIAAAIKAAGERDVADRDQSAAAARDAERAMAQSIGDLGLMGVDLQRVSPDVDERYIAWVLAVGGAIPPADCGRPPMPTCEAWCATSVDRTADGAIALLH
jgi:hypothetical protein